MESLYEKHDIDGRLSEHILGLINEQPGTSAAENGQRYEFPSINGRQIIDGTGSTRLDIPYDIAQARIAAIDEGIPFEELFSKDAEGKLSHDSSSLHELGAALMPYIAFGVLNGGSATSYIDSKKNEGFYPPLYSIIESTFSALAGLGKDKAKGLTPAYTNADGSAGYSFLELKMRSLLLKSIENSRTDRPCRIPMFQMTSGVTDSQLNAAYQEYRESPMVSDLLEPAGYDVTEVQSAVQPLIAAFTAEQPYSIFTRAYGEEDHLLALPGGHGQNFLVLKSIYRKLFAEGKRFAYLVNVDNLGNFPSETAIAVTALTGCDGSFEFSYKTPIDVKGGVLVRDSDRSLTCRDMGVAISREAVAAAEAEGKPILFNCATGLFSLSYLNEHIEQIIEQLPLRVSRQHKDAGEYCQAEQVTWEIIDLMEHPVILAVHKHERFLAAKLLSESIMATRASEIAPRLLEAVPEYEDFCAVSLELEKGFEVMMKDIFKMESVGGIWEPIPWERLRSM